jgi:hypothetical protein
MRNLSREIDANYRAFADASHIEMERVYAALTAQDAVFLSCYKGLVSLQAWRSELLDSTVSEGALGFYLEAQNDGLVSLELARLGSCRAALQNLRSCIENVLFAAYYMDHPVELQLWHAGKHRLTFSQLDSYFSSHPAISSVPDDVTGLSSLRGQYPTLSKAVHGTQLWTDTAARAGKYSTNLREGLMGLNMLLLCLFSEHLQGASKLNLRKAISIAIPRTRHRPIKAALKVTLLAP